MEREVNANKSQNIDEVTKALEELMDVLGKLKESGLLDMLKSVVDKYEDLMTFLAHDRRLFHLMAVAEGALNSMEGVDAIRLKLATQRLAECGLDALTSEEVERAQPMGLTDLLRALRDPDVMAGLGLVISMLKALGKCYNSKRM